MNPELVRLAVRCQIQRNGEIDAHELESYLNEALGAHQWLTTSQWLFAKPPVTTRPGVHLVPVVCRRDAARRLRQLDAYRPAQRVMAEEVLCEVETRQWRWVAFQIWPNARGAGIFPWEVTRHTVN